MGIGAGVRLLRDNSSQIVVANSDDEESAQESEGTSNGDEPSEAGSSNEEEPEGVDGGSEADETHEIEALVARRYRRSVLEYQVKWQGYATSENTREPKGEIPGDMVKAYEAERRKVGRLVHGRQ